MTDNFNKKDTYKITRILHPVEALFEYFISILCSGAFFAKLTMTVGISDSLTAILGSLTSLATGIQIFSIYMAKKTPVKRWVIPMQTIANLGFAAIYILPLLKLSTDTNQVLFFVIILSVRFALSLLAPCKSIWYENVIDDDKRGAHSAVVCIVSHAGSIIFTYLASAMLEYYEKKGDLRTAFIIITVTILVLNVLLMISMLLCREKPSEMVFSESTVKSLKTLFSRKTFRSFLLSHILFSFSTSLTAPFLSTYQLRELNFSMTFIATLSIMTSIVSMLLLIVFGKISTKVPYITLHNLFYPITIVAYLIIFFCNPDNGKIVYVIYIAVTCIYSAINTVTDTSILFRIIPLNSRTTAFAMKSMILGCVTFVSTFIGGKILDYIQSNGNRIFGMELYAQQFLAILTVIGLLITILHYFVSVNRLVRRYKANEYI